MSALAMRKAGIAIVIMVGPMLALDAGGKLLVPEAMIANSPPLGLPSDPQFHRILGAILTTCLALYAFRRTAILGAILLTGDLAGAVAAHARIGSPLLSKTLFGVYLGKFIWLGLWLCRPKLRQLLPLRTAGQNQ